MELADLNEDERVALVALLDKVVVVDRDLTDCEEGELADVVEALGKDAFRRAVEAVRNLESDADLEALLESITRQSAREIIYGTVMEVAMADTVLQSEASLLEWLGSKWGIEIKPAGTNT